jgi:RNA polymerase sigma factor (sigma-70 family)
VQDDSELVASARRGDARAFARIVERYQSLVCAIAYSGTGDLALSQDVAQDTFLAAWKGLQSLNDPGRLRGWLAGIARNLMQNARRGRARERSAEAPLEAAASVPAPSAGPLEQVVDAQEQALLWSALSAVPDTYREPLVLFYREGQSIRAVAEGLELSEDAVKQRLSRGRQMLKDQIAAFVETALARTRPGAAFTAAVVAMLPALLPQAAMAGVAAAAEGSAAQGAAASSAVAVKASGVAGAVAGPLLGVAGAILGVQASIRNTRSPRERAFMVRMAWMCTAYVLAFAAVESAGFLLWRRAFATLAVQLPLWLLYAVGLLVLIVRSNRRQRQIRVEDGTWVDPVAVAAGPPTTAQLWGSMGGGAFGAVCWLIPLAFIAGEPLLAVAVTAAAGLSCWLAVRAAARAPADYFRVGIRLVAALGLLNLAVVNVRWTAWMGAYRRSAVFAYGGREMSLIAVNLMVLAVFGGLVVLFHFNDRNLRRRLAGEPAARP